MSLLSSTSSLECAICLDFFQDPILLSCGHTFNRQCVENLINRSSQLAHCPTCRKAIDPKAPLVPNYAVINYIRSQSTVELFLIDIELSRQQKLAAVFLQRLFRREAFNTRRVIQTMNTRILIDSNQSIDDQLSQVKQSQLVSLKANLEDALEYLKQQNVGKIKLHILTDGSRIHSDVSKTLDVRANLIHLGNQRIDRSRQLADTLHCHFNYLDEQNIDAVVRHFSIDQ